MVVSKERRWKETGNVDINNMTILCGWCNKIGELGVGFVVHKSILPTIKEFQVPNKSETT